jgi:PIN like domain
MAASKEKSKRPSAASSKLRPDKPRFLVDESLGGQLVTSALREAGAAVERLRDHFPPGTPDRDWLTDVGKRGWVVLTKDKRIRRRPAEVAAIVGANVRAFVFTSGNTTGQAMAQAYVAALPAMQQYCRDFAPPFVATVSAAGRVKMFYRPSRGRS